MGKKYKNKKWLKKKHYEKGLSVPEIAKVCDVSDATIYKWFESNNLETRLQGKKYRNKDWLYQHYVEKDLGPKKIGNICSVKGSTIYSWLRKFNIPIKDTNTSSVKKFCAECGKEFYIRPSKENRTKYCSRECHNKAMSEKKIKIDCLNCGKTFNVKPSLEDRRKFCSNQCRDNHMYGVSNDKYSTYEAKRNNAFGNWESNKERALERDSYKCAICGSEEQIQVHHIRPLRFYGTNYIGNLITVCPECHGNIESGVTKRFASNPP